jgi:hypothetical protein
MNFNNTDKKTGDDLNDVYIKTTQLSCQIYQIKRRLKQINITKKTNYKLLQIEKMLKQTNLAVLKTIQIIK